MKTTRETEQNRHRQMTNTKKERRQKREKSTGHLLFIIKEDIVTVREPEDRASIQYQTTYPELPELSRRQSKRYFSTNDPSFQNELEDETSRFCQQTMTDRKTPCHVTIALGV